MTATLTASQAILKRRYPDGRLPKAQFENFPFVSLIQKRENWDGDDKVVALQTENPQGSSSDFATALGSVAQGAYYRFLVSRVEHFGVARIKGQALKAAAKDSGALVDLWRNETDGASATETQMIETYLFGDGTGVLATATFSGAVATLANPEDAAKFALGMRLQAVGSPTSLSPTLRGGGATGTVTAVDRASGTVTIGANWSSTIAGISNNDGLVRAGDTASAGAGRVICGVQQWIAGGTSPGTLWGLSRNADPVRLAGQSYSAANVAMEDAIIDAESLITAQGHMPSLTLLANPRDVRKLKKSLGGKVTYPRTQVNSAIAGVSFKAIEFDGDNGTIKIISSPFCPVGQAMLLALDTFALESLGPAPQMLDFDSNNFLRVANDDAYEVRFGMYGNTTCNAPVKSVRITSWGG